MVSYKQQCKRCKKNYVTVSGRERYVLCYECHKKHLKGEIKNKKMKALFDIPEEYYKENLFLRNIKIYYLRYESLSEKQIAAFKKVVKEYKKSKV